MFIKFENLIVDARRNSRHSLPEIEGLAESLKRHGQRQSVSVYPDDEKVELYHLDSGYRRVAAAMHLGWAGVEATVVSKPKNVTLTNLVENVAREDLTSYEYAQALKKLKADGLSPKLISNSLAGSCSKGTGVKNINTLINLATNLHPVILTAWRDQHPAATVPNLLAIVSQDNQLELWETLIGVRQAADDDAETDGETEASDAEPKPKKRRITDLAKMVKELEARQDIPASARSVAINALQWALGIDPTVLGVTLESDMR
jgi:ParB/RepB/Spo0J family partition protein